ncbi:Bardet-Biedl syndrome 2 -like protein [Trichinella papuae]|uniref:Inhibitor of growth protein n=1 Tax=Trichinella papuae TaxID=268474 RepID=A0A0V1MYA2_9BILA|nr:Bardet-Biedl syndrome 2 -like protein [Trichinella papuae]
MSSFLKRKFDLQMEHWYDVLEAVSPMPGELRDLLTKSHELEIQLQSVLERNDRVSEAFFEAAHNMTDEERGCHFVRIKQYYKEEEDLAKEKVAVMQSVEDLLERYKLVVDQEYNRLRAAFDEESAGRADRIERRVKQEMERQNATLERVHVAARNGRRRKRVHPPKIAGESQPASTVNGGDAATTVSKKSGNSESDNQPQSSSQLATSQANSDAPTVLESLVVKTEQRSDVELPEVKPTPPLITTKNESRHGRLRKVSSRVTALLDAEAATISTTRDHHHGGSHGRSKASKKASTVNTEVVNQADANAEAGDIDDQSIYCYCNQPSYGSMVACDSLTCKYEWFHYECVGVTEAPKGDWYCPDCHSCISRLFRMIYKTSMSLLLQMDNQSPAPSHLAEINENRDRLIKKIEDVGVKIKAAMKTKEADVDEFLRVSGRLHDHESDNPQLLRIRVLFNRKNRKTTQLINSLQLTKLCETGSMRRGITETVLTNVGQGLKDVGVNIKESLSEYTGSVINAPKDFTRRLLKSKSGSADNIALSSTADKHKPAIGSIKSGAKEEDNSVFYFPLHSEDVESSSKDDDQSELSSPIQGVSRGFEDPDDLDPFFEEVRALQNAVASLSREIDRLKAQIQQEYNFFHGALHEEKYRYQHLEDQMNDMVELHQAEISNLKEEVQMIEGRLQYQFRDQIQDIQDLIGQMQTKVEFLEKSTKELQQAVGLENLSDSTAGGQAIRALLLFLQILIMLLVTLWNIVVPFIKSRTRLITTTTFVIFIIYLNKNWDTISAWLWTTSSHFRSCVVFPYALQNLQNEIPCYVITVAYFTFEYNAIALLQQSSEHLHLEWHFQYNANIHCNICDELVKSEEPLFLTCGCKLDICGYCLTRSVNQTGCCPGCHANVSITREWDDVFFDDFIEEGEKAKTRSNSTKSRRKLADLRVLQDNLVSVCGLPLEIADPDTLRSDDYFGKYGKIMRILINKKGKMPIAYITFQRSKDAMQAVAEFGKKDFGGQTVKASLGTTKYCAFFLRNSICKNHDCYFMHSRVPDEAAFTKEDLEKGKHFQYQKKLVDDYIKQRAMRSMKLQADKLKNEPPSTFTIGKKNGTAWGKIEREIRNPIFGDYENDENSTVAKNELEKNECSPLARKWQTSEVRKLREKNDDCAELVGNAWNNIRESRLKNLFGERQSNLDAECETEDRTKDFEKQPPVIHIPCQHPFVSIKMANGMFSVSDVTSPSEVAFSSEAEQVAKPVAADVLTEGKRFAFDGKFENKSDSHFSDSFSARNVSDYDKWNGGIYGRLRNLNFDEMTDLNRQATVPPRAAFSIPQNESQSTFKKSVWKGNQKTWKDVLGFACQNDFPPLSVSAKGHSWKENAMVGGTKFDENFFGGASRISDTNSASASQMDWRKNEGQTGSSIYNALFEQENNKCKETFSPNPILNTERGTIIRDNFGGNNVNMSLNYGDNFNEMATTFTQNAQFEEVGVAFTVKLNHKIAPKAVTMGHFDDDQCSLVAVDNVGKVFLHTIEALKNAECIDDSTLPRFRLNQNASAMMNINRMVKIVATGHLKASDTCDAIVIGTATHILVYDVKNNCDLFYKEVSGGLESILIGRFGDFEEELIVCGGSCALQGFNWQGKEIFWSVTGDNVRSLCFCDFDSDGKLELLVGSDDFDIRVFKGDEIVSSISETEAVTNLLSLGSNRFAYALANGTLGVYASSCRLWRIKSKANPTFLCLYDIDGDDEQELVTGWSSGKVDFRKCQNGELVAKDHMSSAIVGMEIFGLSAKEGAYLLCCSSSGEVRGYFASSGKRNLIPFDTVRDTIRNLSIERQNLLVELENYEEKEIAAQSQLSSDNMALRIPTDTQVTQKLEVVVKENTEQPYLQLSLCTNNRTVLRGAIIFAERIFPGESYALLVPKEESCEKLEIPLRLEKDTASDLHIKALVGYSRSSKLYVFDLNQALPKFSMYALCNDTAPCPKNGVEFNIGDRGDLLCQWMMKNFLIDQANLSRDKFTVRFMNLRISCLIFIKLNDNGKVEICCDDIEVCGSMMQSLASYVDLEFKVTAYFPDIAKKYADLAKKVSKVSAVQDRLSADMSEQISIAKSVLLHGEDSRVLEDWYYPLFFVNAQAQQVASLFCRLFVRDKMKEHYKQLSSLNDTLLSLQNVRLGNSAHLSDLLKRINQIIQNASNLKVGKHRSALIRACRSAIAAGNTASVRKLLDLDG